MKVSSDFLLREVADEIMLIPVNEMSMKYNGLITMNEVSKTLWTCLQEDTTREALVQALLDEYEVSEELAARDVDAFLKKLGEMGILVE